MKNQLGITLKKDQVYRFLDILDKDSLSSLAFRFVSKRHQQQLSLVFYDVSTLYFESNREDEIRSKGYSKDHRHDMPQVMIGLFVDKDGFPFDFHVFAGRTFEGHTLADAISNLQQKYTFKQLNVVADAGMLSKDNLKFLDSQKVGFIVGARLKNLPIGIEKTVINHNYSNTPILETSYQGRRLIVDYSVKRAKKDKANRDKLISQLKDRLARKQTLIRKSKYLKTSGANQIEGIDETKIFQDSQFDGLKGYLVNQVNHQQKALSKKGIITQYHNLWQVEKAFRMSKHDLCERPIYHSKPKRIQAHLTLCYVSLLVMKEAERIFKKHGYSLNRAIKLLSQVGKGTVRIGKTTIELEAELNQDTQSILQLVGH